MHDGEQHLAIFAAQSTYKRPVVSYSIRAFDEILCGVVDGRLRHRYDGLSVSGRPDCEHGLWYLQSLIAYEDLERGELCEEAPRGGGV
ncbi:unnamed protein product [Strongylus vulgaris]|uniref:Uncharacterized protein n=1 Tax=Strongylus vulgaris TaxID=40348 RepID=A0A3P7JGD5_STRVU|nr:unnamed protein product [Strongylus vulgaris]